MVASPRFEYGFQRILDSFQRIDVLMKSLCGPKFSGSQNEESGIGRENAFTSICRKKKIENLNRIRIDFYHKEPHSAGTK